MSQIEKGLHSNEIINIKRNQKNFNTNSDNNLIEEFVLKMQMDDLIKICSVILEKIIILHKSFKVENLENFCIFESDIFCNFISISDYIENTSHFMKYDKFVLILSMMNLDKFLEMNVDFVLTKSNCYKLIFTCIMETNKFYDDNFITNKIYSRIGGIDINELLNLEMEFLTKIDWKMNLDENKFYNYSKKLETFFLSH